MRARAVSKPASRPALRPVIRTDKVSTEVLLSGLEELTRDDTASSSARMAAARTLLEVKGLIGRNQLPPGQGTHAVPTSLTTRPELEAELARLRALKT